MRGSYEMSGSRIADQMKQYFIRNDGNDRLILFFGGWGSWPSLFMDNKIADGYDCLLCYDYREMTFDPDLLTGYSRVCVLAWSMGVAVADRILSGYLGPASSLHGYLPCIESATAVGGTVFPVNDRFGIPEAVFSGTLENMSEQVLARFRRRMCGKDLEYYMSCRPDRNSGELKDELTALQDFVKDEYEHHMRWDLAVVGGRDMIFPAANQSAAWEYGPEEYRAARIVKVDAAHYSSALFDYLLGGGCCNCLCGSADDLFPVL